MASETVRVVAAVISDGPRFLVCQRPLNKRHGGLWEFPGGKVEPNESDLDAARRELREELCVEVLATERPIFERQDPGSPFLIVFLPVSISGAPVCVEHADVVWGTPKDLLRLPLAPSDRQFVEFLASRP